MGTELEESVTEVPTQEDSDSSRQELTQQDSCSCCELVCEGGRRSEVVPARSKWVRVFRGVKGEIRVLPLQQHTQEHICTRL